MSKNQNALSEQILRDYPIQKAIVKLALPAILAMLTMALYNLVDTLFIGMLDSDEALTAVGVAFPIMSLIGAFGQVLGGGVAACVGRYFGAGREQHASEAATTTIYTAIAVGIMFMIVGIVFIEPIFKLFGASDEVMPYAVQYGIPMYVGAIFSIPNQTFNNLARAETKATLSMKSLMVGSIANIILDPIFMFDFGFGMGLEGASIATTIAQAIAFAYVSSHFFGKKTRVVVKPSNFKPSFEIYSDVIRSGAPIGITNLLSTMAVAATNIVAGIYTANGDDMVAAYGVSLKVLTLIQLSLMGFMQGFQPVASYAYGARNKERFYGAFWLTFKIQMIACVILTIGVQLFTANIIGLFTDTPQILEIGVNFLRYSNSMLIFTAMGYLAMFTFQATGDGKRGAVIALSRQGIIYLPLLFIFAMNYGDSGIYFAQPIADLATGIIAIILFKRFMNQVENYFDNKKEEI